MRAETDAAIAQLVAAGVARVYRIGAVPTSPVTPYCVLSVDAGSPRNYRTGSVATSRARRIAVQVVGKDYTEAAWAAEKADAAFLHKRLTGVNSTPCRREIATTIQRDPDGGALMYGLSTYTLTTS